MARAPSLTPMLRHYLEVKAGHPDALLFYRMGDFYELFFEDAQRAAPILEVTLTARQKGTDSEAPMCGVPHHALGGYLKKAIRAGFKVAVCEQVEDPAAAKGLVRREVTRVVTPGTLSDPDLLEDREENLLAAVIWEGAQGAIAFLDVSTGRLSVRRAASAEDAVEALELRRPAEVLWLPCEAPAGIASWMDRQAPCRSEIPEGEQLRPAEAARLVCRHFAVSSLAGFGLGDDEVATRAVAAALAYAEQTQFAALDHVRSVFVEDPGEALILDSTTISNLDVLVNSRQGGRRGTLLGVLDRTQTPPGGRCLKEWLRRPLRDPAKIARRHQAVRELADQAALRESSRSSLARIGDFERLLSRGVLGTLSPREAAALRDGLLEVPSLFTELGTCQAELLVRLASTDPLVELADLLQRQLAEAPAGSLKDGGVIAAGVDADLDRYRSLARDQKLHLLALEKEERSRTGIASLKVRYNRVFGYYIEVSKSNQHLVPETYIRKQTLVNAERYVTPEIKELEEAILTAEERQLTLESELFEALVGSVAGEAARLSRLGDAVGQIDALASFAEVAARRGYVVPKMGVPGAPIRISGGRHPVVEAVIADPFVPNDVDLDEDSTQIVILTGPNMGGKSTYLRQVALLVLMAQAGSLVPAEQAEIGVVDRIFTRVGASDDLARGESTFMVEMIETARILHHATSQSLVILDEVGRGTATFDGLSLAWAIVEHLHQHRRPKTLFATHYHELTELTGTLPRVVNRTMAVKEWQDQILFLRRVIPGTADKSYGLHVARLAGLPPEVIRRATEVLANLEDREVDGRGRPRLARGDSAPPNLSATQLALFTPVEQVVASILSEVEVERLTPLAALNLIASLKDRLLTG